MRVVRLKQFIQMTSVVAGVIGLAMDAGYASEISRPTEDELAVTETTSLSTEAVVSSSESQTDQVASATFTTAALPLATPLTHQPSEKTGFLQDPAVLLTAQDYVFQTKPLTEPLIDVQRSDTIASIVPGSDLKTMVENTSSDSDDISNSVQTLPEFEPLVSSSADLGTAQSVDHQQFAQAASSTETPTESDSSEPATESEDSSPRWRFAIIPYAFVPVSVNGSATVRNFTADINLGLDDILSPLNFAAAGRVEAWRGNLGLIFDGSYFNLSQENTQSVPIPNCLCNIFPSEITADVKVQYGQFDLGVGYRIAENVNQAESDFDLGPLAFDAIVGVRIYALRQEIDLSTNLDTDRNFEGSGTLVQPLISGRLRWNLSPTLAGWARGDLAGLGLGGTLLAASVTGGLDWMFSGDTSLLLAYRLSSLDYQTEVGGQNLELNLLFHGPYLGVVFRF